MPADLILDQGTVLHSSGAVHPHMWHQELLPLEVALMQVKAAMVELHEAHGKL